MKTKAAFMGKVGGNNPAPSAPKADDPTAVSRAGGVMPTTVAPPNQYDPGYPVQGRPSPFPKPAETTLAVFGSPVAGNTDTGVGHTGDLGGAGGR